MSSCRRRDALRARRVAAAAATRCGRVDTEIASNVGTFSRKATSSFLSSVVHLHTSSDKIGSSNTPLWKRLLPSCCRPCCNPNVQTSHVSDMAHPNAPSLTVKCRCPDDTFTLTRKTVHDTSASITERRLRDADLAPSMKFEDFQAMVHEKSGIAPSLQIMKTGFPPSLLEPPPSPATTSIGTLLRHGDLIVVSERATTDETMPDGTTQLTGPIRSGYFPVLPSSTGSCSELTVSHSSFLF